MTDSRALGALSDKDVAQMANAIRALAMDAVQKANSGHPGMPMGMAEIAVALWGRHLSHNPANPRWANRDRFVLSNGHGSMLQYALLHLTGYDLPIEELVKFRQLHSRTPGHPEHGLTPGVETTTGPLGQGLANAVGMALAEKLLAAEFNRPGFDIVDHRTWVFLGDGCLMEGISHEAASLAGTWQLGKLVAIHEEEDTLGLARQHQPLQVQRDQVGLAAAGRQFDQETTLAQFNRAVQRLHGFLLVRAQGPRLPLTEVGVWNWHRGQRLAPSPRCGAGETRCAAAHAALPAAAPARPGARGRPRASCRPARPASPRR